jgi:hypothetical protein
MQAYPHAGAHRVARHLQSGNSRAPHHVRASPLCINRMALAQRLQRVQIYSARAVHAVIQQVGSAVLQKWDSTTQSLTTYLR